MFVVLSSFLFKLACFLMIELDFFNTENGLLEVSSGLTFKVWGLAKLETSGAFRLSYQEAMVVVLKRFEKVFSFLSGLFDGHIFCLKRYLDLLGLSKKSVFGRPSSSHKATVTWVCRLQGSVIESYHKCLGFKSDVPSLCL